MELSGLELRKRFLAYALQGKRYCRSKYATGHMMTIIGDEMSCQRHLEGATGFPCPCLGPDGPKEPSHIE